jgi:hypothetical protein
MELLLIREVAIGDATIGTLSIDGKFQCFTLEDVVREKKIAAETAIPAGAYPVILCESPRFSDRYEKLGRGRIVPLIDRVPGYTGVRIHCGNVAGHTEGCVLVGDWADRTVAKIVNSHLAFVALMKVLNGAKGSLRLTIRNALARPEEKLKHASVPLYEGLFPMCRAPEAEALWPNSLLRWLPGAGTR